MAVAWFTQQVSHGTVIACDPPTCAALEAAGFPSASLRVLGSTSSYPLSSAIVIETAYVRTLFGTSLRSDWAPVVITTFGTGSVQFVIRVIAPHGAAAYQHALMADLANRKQNGIALLSSSQITVSGTAKAQMSAGEVDSRLLFAISALAAAHPVDVVDFGNVAVGASAGVPLRYADLAEPAAHLSTAAYEQSVRSLLDVLPSTFQALSITTVRQTSGRIVLRVVYSAPSTLGLLAPTGPRSAG